MKQCGECGKGLTPSAAVCPECGTEVFDQDPDQEEPEPQGSGPVNWFLTDQEAAAIQAAQIPVDSFNPGTYWAACLDRESEMPTGLELRQLHSIIEYLVQSRHVSVKTARQFAEGELAKESGFNTMIFRKDRHHGGWRFRRASWADGPLFVPSPIEREYRPLSLAAAMDRLCEYRREPWEAWKVAHADLFPIHHEVS
jgi:hypothetical protein